MFYILINNLFGNALSILHHSVVETGSVDDYTDFMSMSDMDIPSDLYSMNDYEIMAFKKST